MRFVTFGEIMLRLAPPHHKRLLQADFFEAGFAGAEANVAVSLANYGDEAIYVTCLPDNPIAMHCIRTLMAQGVDTSHIQKSGERIGVLYLEQGSNARPSKVIYDRQHSSIAGLIPGSIDWKSILKDADWFHWTGITPALSSNAAKECLSVLKVCADLGVTVSCDINYRKNLWRYGKEASEVLPSLVALTDIVMGNEEDFEKVFGIQPENFDVENTEGVVDMSAFRSVCCQVMEKFPRIKKIAMTLRVCLDLTQLKH